MRTSSTMLGAVLTGGESRRMGRDKARLELGGESLGSRAIRTLRSELEEVIVVSRHLGDHADFGVPEVADRLPGNGPLGGLHAALAEARGRSVFALACDLPAAGRELIAHVIARAEPTFGSTADARAIVPVLSGRVQPLCGVYSAACAAEIERRLARGERRVLDLLAAIETTRVDLGPGLGFYRPDLLDNVNDPEAARRFGLERVLIPD